MPTNLSLLIHSSPKGFPTSKAFLKRKMNNTYVYKSIRFKDYYSAEIMHQKYQNQNEFANCVPDPGVEETPQPRDRNYYYYQFYLLR
jgi:peptide methionine sulfoxide reductase MsrA